MELVYFSLLIIQFVDAFSMQHKVYINSDLECLKDHNFFHPSEEYIFSSNYHFTCKFPVSTINLNKQYCVYIDEVYIDRCMAEMRIYEGLNLLHKTPKVTLTCDETVKTPFCVWGSKNGIFIEYKSFRKSGSTITIRFEESEIPKTTTSFTPNDEEASFKTETDITTIMIILVLMIAGLFFFGLLCYCCCCRFSGNEGTLVRQPQNYRQPEPVPLFSDPVYEQSLIPPRGHDYNYRNSYDLGPPDYNTSTSLPLVEPSAPPMESQDPMLLEPPPSYDSVIQNIDSYTPVNR